jgi:tRNA(Ile)-lysidine synthase TilS/MesJ
MTPLLRSTSLTGELADQALASIARYGLLPAGAKTAVALSGGVDSWAALALLAALRAEGRLDIDLRAFHIDLGFPGAAPRLRALAQGCAAAGAPLAVRRTEIGPAAIADGAKRPCFLCARQRRRALFEMAAREGVTHLVTGHHRDDVLSSFLLNLLENREVSTLTPRRPVFDGRFFLVRPLYEISKEQIRKLHRQQQFPVETSGCPVDGRTRRQEALELLDEIERRFPGARHAIFQALHRVKPDFLPQMR